MRTGIPASAWLATPEHLEIALALMEGVAHG
nr:MAG TPA: hypothetical protein [Caudoviricetes sp.]